ncbi:4-(cytidine 5'-diphospho)-2-C-methyl-D-erythritol kinase [Sporolactobacillus shoreicorticis]|uniref:4-diphosphocytidyl-2-C-methyl-D-erythritol kinase n=1 Tax=Sporolactobacillus shoreicorticis TaxID=1923877 RepID=A0ABW5SAY7_9BACL|nr:4-(cytidine 5'-diphospho)-2-C-methyl-D-erythritol kinase [Sporolactobacillus shoreicorticis]MCO7127725.1 4-(cytidine 5'-diphospho)-2-C-methyl-D-erythritol kinase [Sporolactobacillus shoreicorticis]
MKILEKAPAKINLSLDVLGNRNDGYHEVKMVMTSIDLADRVECGDLHENRITVRTSAPYVPEDERNFAYQAAKYIKECYDIHRGVEIMIKKNIPVAAGLAGGSTDAAATIRALDKLWHIGMSYKEMQQISAKIGSDVAFCIKGGTALATGRGERIMPLMSLPPCWVVLVKPNVSVSTAQIYKDLDSQPIIHPDVDAMIRAIEKEDFQTICGLLGNSLEPVTMRRVADIAKIKDHMKAIGAEGILMSGSGPTVFALTQHESRMLRLMNGMRGYCSQVFAVRLCKPFTLLSEYE